MKKNINFQNLNNEKIKDISKKGLKIIKKTIFTGILGITVLTTGCGREETNDPYENVRITEGTTGKHVYFGEDVGNDFLKILEELGEDVTSITIESSFIDDLSKIPTWCPNLKNIKIEQSPSIDNLDFIYKLENLEEVTIIECGFTTPELVNYLNEKGIEHNITTKDLEINKEIDNIINNIITPDMTDEEKIQAITSNVISNYDYKLKTVKISNSEPLTSMIETKKGVCAGYAYLTNTLLRKANITSYQMVYHKIPAGHAWNLIELDGKYYYLDTTNVSRIPFLSKFMLEKFNIGLYYMTDPKATSFSAMKDYDKEIVLIPESLIEDIKRGEEEKNLIEKYGNSVPARVIELITIMTGITIGINLASKGIEELSYRKRKR